MLVYSGPPPTDYSSHQISTTINRMFDDVLIAFKQFRQSHTFLYTTDSMRLQASFSYKLSFNVSGLMKYLLSCNSENSILCSTKFHRQNLVGLLFQYRHKPV